MIQPVGCGTQNSLGLQLRSRTLCLELQECARASSALVPQQVCFTLGSAVTWFCSRNRR
jgi:hypothetical protein